MFWRVQCLMVFVCTYKFVKFWGLMKDIYNLLIALIFGSPLICMYLDLSLSVCMSVIGKLIWGCGWEDLWVPTFMQEIVNISPLVTGWLIWKFCYRWCDSCLLLESRWEPCYECAEDPLILQIDDGIFVETSCILVGPWYSFFSLQETLSPLENQAITPLWSAYDSPSSLIEGGI